MILVILFIWCLNGRIQNKKLFAAIEKDDYIGVQTAIKRGAWVNTRRHMVYLPQVLYTNPTPLIKACKLGNESIIELLLDSGADINKADNFTGQTALMGALHGNKANRFSLAAYMIENGADIHVSVQAANSPVQNALYVSKDDNEKTIKEGFELLKYLIEHDADMTIYSSDENALTYAVHYRNYNAVRYLIENGYFDIDSRDQNGNTALEAAELYEDYEMIELLNTLMKDKDHDEIIEKY